MDSLREVVAGRGWRGRSPLPRRKALWVREFLLLLVFLLLTSAPASASTAEEISALPTLDALNRSEEVLSNSGKWSALAWDSSATGHNTGRDTTTGWGPYDAFATVNGAYWNPATFNDKAGNAAAITMQTGPGNSERYVALWLDMTTPGSAKSGYQLRWTVVSGSTYSMTLSKFSAGTQTVLASNSAVTIPAGATLAISDTGGTVTAWQGAGGSLASILSAPDTTYTSGYAGIEGSGNISRSLDFKAGVLRDTALAINSLSVLDPLNRAESVLSNGGKWSALAWATNTSGHATGRDTEVGWSPYDAFSAINGAYWNQSTFSEVKGSAAAITMQTAPGLEERYVSLWLDMASPGSTKSGYQLRWRALAGANSYKVTLSKWSSGTETVLAEQASTEIAPGTTMAISDTGQTVTAWKGTGGSLTSILSATDTAFISGYAGMEGSGNLSRSLNFKAGSLDLLVTPDTIISGGPSGAVVPNLSFTFTASPVEAAFECSLDGSSYSACTSPKSYQGLAEGSHAFGVRAKNAAGTDQTPAQRSFQVVQAAKAVTKVPGLDNFERQEVPLATGKWSKSGWSGQIGGAWCCGLYRGYGSSGGLAGAYWNPTSFSDGGETVLVAGKVGTGSPWEGEYLALWLDMPNPGSVRSGYEARFTGVSGSASNYKVELSKWSAGTRTILASSSGFTLSVGTTMALTETSGGNLTLWTGTTSLSPVLTANDSTYTGGYAGAEVNGGAGTIYDFRAGRIDIQPPDTSIQSGPSGIVSPQNVTFTFTATEAGSSFECSIDGGAYSVCSSPKSYPSLAAGPHTFRVRAVDAVGNQDATPAERGFEVAKPPTVSTGGATGVGSSEATLHGSVNPNGIGTTYQFEYGLTAAYGKVVPATPKSAGAGSQTVAVEELVTGLEAETTYHFRLVATNGTGTANGSDETFTTLSPSPVRVLVFGQAAEAPSATLVSPQQPLLVSAGDEGGKIEELQLRIDGQTDSTTTRQEALEQDATESCFGGVCTLEFEYPSVFPPDVGSGQHTFEVRAIGEHGEATFARQVLVDAGIPSLVLGGSLVETDGKFSSSSATVTANVQDGGGNYDSGLSSIKFYVDGVYQSGMSAQCGGGCPAEGSSIYEYLQSKWGTGPHELTVFATDAAGNEDSETLMVNQSLATVEPSCSTVKPTSAPVGNSVSTAQATQAIEATLPAVVAPPTPDPEAEGFEPTLAEGKAASEGADAFMARGGLIGGRVVRGSRRAFTIGQASCLIPLQTTGAESAPEVLASSGTVVYANTAPETDTFFRNNGVGATLVASFRGPNAPTNLSWAVSLKSGQKLEALASGSVAIIASKGIDLPAAQLPLPPAGIGDPKKLGDTATVLDAASYELRKANNEVTGAVEAVIPPALVVGSSGAVQQLPLTVVEGERIVAAVPAGAKAMVVRTDSSPKPDAICAAAFEDDPRNYANGCLPDQGESGERPYITGMDWAPDGSFVYTAFWDESGIVWEQYIDWNPAESFLYRANADGTEIEELETSGFKVIGAPKVSPDGTKIVFNGCSLVSFECGVVLTDASGDGGALLATTAGHSKETRIAFSNDGSRLLYEKGIAIDAKHEERQIYSMKLDGTGQKQLTNLSQVYGITRTQPPESWEVRGTLNNAAVAVDPTSDTLVLEAAPGLYAMHESQEKASLANMTRLTFEPGDHPAFNPAGTKIAYSYNAGKGNAGIFVINKDGSGKKLVLPSGGAYEERAIYPVYSHDGSEIAYIRNGLIYRAPAAGGPSTLAVESDTSGVRSLAEAIAVSDPDPTHLAIVEAAETTYLSSSGPGSVLEVAEAVNQWEVEFCITHLGECKAFNDDRELALAARGALFTNRYKRDTSTRGNAFQHGFWTALMVRSSIEETNGLPNGLVYALNHEERPFNWDARQDIVNDLVGYVWFLENGLEIVSETETEIIFRRVNKLEVCQGILPKGKNAIHVGGHVNPFWWVEHHPPYEFKRLIFRWVRSEHGTGPKVWPNGRTCAEVWPVIT